MMQILILGAGYAGLRAALDLAAAKREGRLDGATVTLLDRNGYHQVITWLHEVAAAAVPAEKGRIALERLLAPGGVNWVQSGIRGIAPAEQRVVLESGETMIYDRLVVALGSVTLWPPIPGLRERALPLRWWEEAVTIRQAVRVSFERAAKEQDEAERRRLLTVVVGGGGYTGCQLAGELAHWVPELADEFGLPLLELTLLQIEARERLLPGWEPALAGKAEQILRRKGVQLLLDSPLERLEPEQMILRGGRQVPYGVFVWCGGVEAPPLLRASGFETGVQGRVRVDEYLRARGHPDVFVAGDCALWMEEGKPLPATASHALRQGEYVARMLMREVEGEALQPYAPTHLGLVVSLGGNDGVGTALGVPLFGVPAGLLKEGIEAWYRSTIER